MPLVKIEIIKGKSLEYKKTLIDCISQAFFDAWSIPKENVIRQIYEFDYEHFIYPPDKTEDIIIIELLVFQGRTYEAKKKLYQSIIDNLENYLNIKPTDVVIILNESPKDNWFMSGVPASEIEYKFKMDI